MKKILPLLLLGLVLCSSLALPPSQFLMKGKKDTVRLDVGALTPVTDSTNVVWDAEYGFTGGEILSKDLPKLPEIYRTERVGDFTFSQPMPNGKYRVTLYFCETSYISMDEAKGKRSFDINIENIRDPIKDLSRAAGGVFRPLVKIYEITVRDGKLDMSFTSTPLDKTNFSPACLSALMIEPRSSDKAF